MSEVLVSVICLTFNHEKMIEDALKGFVMQKTTFPFEVIVHDDASTDGTAAVIRRYAEQYPDIIKPIYQTENQYQKRIGITNTIVLPRTKGKYLAFCEGDDFWTDENKLQRQVMFLEEHEEYTACVHNSIRLDCTNGEQTVMFPREDDCDITFEDTLYAWPRTYQTGSLVMRRQYREQLPDFCRAVKGFMDWPMSIWLAISGKIRFFKEPMSTYRYLSCPHSFMATKKTKDQCPYIEKTLIMLKAVIPYVDGENRSLLDEAILRKEYQLLKYQYNINAMLQEPYKRIYNEEPLKEKVKLQIKRLFPRVVKKMKERKG